MQRDMKIGMALGVALVGIVGALFFRREPETGEDKTPPSLPKAEQLDREIAEKAKTPYIQGLEDFDATSSAVPPPNGSAKLNSGLRSERSTGKDDSKLRELASGKPTGNPDPLRPIKSEAPAVDTDPAHNRDWQPIGPSAGAGKKPGEKTRSGPDGSTIGAGRTHVIRPGDTLSGLASRYLGSSARFREIYEANRDQLRSADDVREGMTLRIPDAGNPGDGQAVAETPEAGRSPAGPSRTKSQSGTKARNVSTSKKSDGDELDPPAKTAPSADTPREKVRFVPVPRGPFSAGRVSQPDAN